MKKFLPLIGTIICFAVCVVTAFVMLVYAMLGGADFSLPQYYVNDDVYEKIELTVDFIKVDDDRLYLSGSHNADHFDNYFIIFGENLEVISENGLLDKMTEGDNIIVISAPGYFGDGWKYPIAGVEYDGEIYLKYDTGKTNIVEKFKADNEAQADFFEATFIVLGFSLAIGVLLLVVFIKGLSKTKGADK